MENKELIGETTMKLLDEIQDDSDGHVITDVLVVVHAHVEDETENGRAYVQFQCSNVSWVFQLGLATAVVEAMNANRGWPNTNDGDEGG